jgi:hypothetical protein
MTNFFWCVMTGVTFLLFEFPKSTVLNLCLFALSVVLNSTHFDDSFHSKQIFEQKTLILSLYRRKWQYRLK